MLCVDATLAEFGAVFMLDLIHRAVFTGLMNSKGRKIYRNDGWLKSFEKVLYYCDTTKELQYLRTKIKICHLKPQDEFDKNELMTLKHMTD